MTTDFDIHVHVDLGVTPELVALVNAVIGHRQMPTAEAPAGEQTARAPKPKRGRKAASEEPAPEPEAPQAEAEAQGDAPEEAQAEEPQPEAEGPKELTEQDVRDAMHKTRQRIEGENYKEETDSENYKKYHRQLTSQFKNIAALLGADKPSALPADKRQAFINECADLIIGEDGTIQSKPAPF